MRKPDEPFADDWSLELSDVRFEIASRKDDGEPTSLRMRFAPPLEDEERVFVIWSPERFTCAIDRRPWV